MLKLRIQIGNYSNPEHECVRIYIFNITRDFPLPHLQFALSEQCAELSDALCCDGVALGLVFGHLVLQGDEADGGALLFLQAEEL